MIESVARQAFGKSDRELPGQGKRVSFLGVPLHYGQSKAGVDLGPGAIRVAKLTARIGRLGYEVTISATCELTGRVPCPCPAKS